MEKKNKTKEFPTIVIAFSLAGHCPWRYTGFNGQYEHLFYLTVEMVGHLLSLNKKALDRFKTEFFYEFETALFLCKPSLIIQHPDLYLPCVHQLMKLYDQVHKEFRTDTENGTKEIQRTMIHVIDQLEKMFGKTQIVHRIPVNYNYLLARMSMLDYSHDNLYYSRPHLLRRHFRE